MTIEERMEDSRRHIEAIYKRIEERNVKFNLKPDLKRYGYRYSTVEGKVKWK